METIDQIWVESPEDSLAIGRLDWNEKLQDLEYKKMCHCLYRAKVALATTTYPLAYSAV
jgi:hypothetical protein